MIDLIQYLKFLVLKLHFSQNVLMSSTLYFRTIRYESAIPAMFFSFPKHAQYTHNIYFAEKSGFQAKPYYRKCIVNVFYLLKAYFAIKRIFMYVSEIIHETRQGYTHRQRMPNQLSGQSRQRILLLRRRFLQRRFLSNVKCNIGRGSHCFLLVKGSS